MITFKWSYCYCLIKLRLHEVPKTINSYQYFLGEKALLVAGICKTTQAAYKMIGIQNPGNLKNDSSESWK